MYQYWIIESPGLSPIWGPDAHLRTGSWEARGLQEFGLRDVVTQNAEEDFEN